MRNSETLMLQDVWRRAYKAPEGLTIRFKSKAGAVRARMQLYNAVAAQKRGKDMSDPELVRAAEELEIVWVEDCIIRLQKRAESDMMQGIMEALGTKPEDYVDPDAKASADRMLEQLASMGLVQGMSPPPPKVSDSEVRGTGDHLDNPFYGKRS